MGPIKNTLKEIGHSSRGNVFLKQKGTLFYTEQDLLSV